MPEGIISLIEGDVEIVNSQICESGIDSDMGSSGGGGGECMCDLEG